MFSFKNMAQKRIERTMRQGQIHSIESVFGKSLAVLQGMFPMHANKLEHAALPVHTSNRYLGDIGINAFVHTQEIEVGQYPLFVNRVRQGREVTGWRQFSTSTTTSLLVSESRFSGATVRLLTNDIALICDLSAGDFNPPPPWIVWYEHGPFIHASQGDMAYWFDTVWDTYWESLSLQAQAVFLQARRADTVAYISEADWAEWVTSIKLRDPRTSDALESHD